MQPRDLVVLSGETQTVEIPFRARVAGTAAAETVRVPSGGDVRLQAGEGDAVRLPGALDAYDVSASGNQLDLVRDDGTHAAISLNAPVSVGFDGGAATARLDTSGARPVVTLGDVPVDSAFNPGRVALTEPAADAPPAAGGNGVFLRAGPGTVTVPFDARVTGTAAAETVRVPAGASVEVVAGGGDRVALPAPFDAYTASASGNQLTLTNGETRVRVALNATSEIAFADGTATAAVRVIDGVATPVLAGRPVGPDGAPDATAPDSPAISSLAGGVEAGARGVGANGQVFVAGEGPTTAVPANGTTLTVGLDGRGRVTAANGAELVLAADSGRNLVVGARDGADGRVDLRGDGTRLSARGAESSIIVGDAGSGTLTLRDGAAAAARDLLVGRAGTGEVTLAGPEVLFTVGSADGGSGFAAVGGASGSRGTLTVRDGGTVAFDAAAGDGPSLVLGQDPDSLGRLIVEGADSAVRFTRDSAPENMGPGAIVGAGLGRGVARIADGGELAVTGPGAGLTVSAGNPAASTAPAADVPVEQSALTIRTGGAVTVGGPADPASTANARLAIGSGPVADGALTVAGADARLSVDGAVAPTLVAGGAGQGSLTVREGARVDGRFLFVANQDGTGQVTVEGAGSTLELAGVAGPGAGTLAGAGASALVGGTGMGSLTVRDGGSVGLSAPEGAAPLVAVARADGAVGTVRVRGAESSLRLDGPAPGGEARALLTVGERGDGELTVAGGGEVVAAGASAALIARTSGATGRVIVEGEGSRFETGGELLVGAGVESETRTPLPSQGGQGTLVVGDGGRLAAGTAVDDAGPDILVGASGVLRVAPEGAVSGDLRIAGGTLVPADGPAVTPIDGDLDHAGATTLEIDGAGAGERDLLDVAGAAALSGEVTIDVAPGFAPQPGDRFALIEAEDAVTIADELDLQTAGVPDGLAVELVADGGSLFARFADDAA
ncbi:T5SS/PEP-CTERM-associated repeat-containing protein [Limimonas halophila]|uniref:T5SS/PEP-CTERM-associated repeat-containing protein n=1 Tax=Limimonas halophila TaxID=1082479 RepID=A0A1G7RZ86_9PROT|nr:hypothetical protein [Limimonas halophila]SDG16067.1 T5SS/PEP-CTERM-associated repeat-containing protein [Limimonas halophila]